MEEEDSPVGAVRSTGPDRRQQGDVEDSGSCNGIPPSTELSKTVSNQAGARSDHSGQGSRCATGIKVLKRNMKRNGSRGCVTRKARFGSKERDWLKGDTQRGCVCLYGAAEPQPSPPAPQSSSTSQADLQLVLCSTSTTVEELCAQGESQSLYLQLHGDLLRRLDPSERPLQMVYDYLAAMGYGDPLRIQKEAANSDLSCMIRFYSGE
ncbi:hypothetical protein JZ751_020915 [Albula glossodonta]|uniref:PHLPP-like RA domain-containing protein n=1 Tax=Albula glossodonta TaxID=121402 RepID=A0A8T2PLU7_9TELE|nr:hypothetical protein JZ751_020915 [Albula glossodonta]